MCVSSEEHAFSHCVLDRLSLFVKMEVKESIRCVFSLKKYVGIGLRMRVFSMGIEGKVH